eukprot:6829610-Pyramimonas_sp.AAC.1
MDTRRLAGFDGRIEPHLCQDCAGPPQGPQRPPLEYRGGWKETGPTYPNLASLHPATSQS